MELSELGLSEEQLSAVQKAIQSESDKVRTDYSTKLKTANDELLKYKPFEKSDAEKALEQKQKELEAKEKELANKERAYTVQEKLTEKGLPSGLAKYLSVGEDIDTAINELGGTLNNYFLENGFKPTNHPKNEGITKEQFSKMSYSEREKLFTTNPELYKKFTQ
ncbi:MAG: hypothetical protein K0S47_3984 [Herbinix sp.]|jgi:hypothetical protein|nr:hypothetical protein [Herbinix sp.]